MTIEEAKKCVGRVVVYSGDGIPDEYGEITSANEKYAFVRYGREIHSKATNPEYLRLAIGGVE